MSCLRCHLLCGRSSAQGWILSDSNGKHGIETGCLRIRIPARLGDILGSTSVRDPSSGASIPTLSLGIYTVSFCFPREMLHTRWRLLVSMMIEITWKTCAGSKDPSSCRLKVQSLVRASPIILIQPRYTHPQSRLFLTRFLPTQ
jgi:hypothetical protein